MDNSTLLRGLKNIGPTIADRLGSVGVRTVGDLREITPAQAFNRVKAAYPDMTIPVCYYLYSLEGALEDQHWNELAAVTKERLLNEAGVVHPKSRSTRPGQNQHTG